MSTTTPSTSDTSVTFSLAELAKLERERVREEDAQRTRSRESVAREQKEAEARRHAAEVARLEAEAEARAKRVREEAEQQARLEARERAAADVARIEAQAKARLDADNAQRAHELAMLRVRTEGGRRRLQIALAAVIGVAAFGGGTAAYGVQRHVTALEQDSARLRDGQQALARERENAKATELSALDRRHASLRARPLVREAEDARATAEAARRAIDPKTLDHDRLRAFGDALDALQGRLETVEKIAELDRRHADLGAWAAERKRSEITAAARSAASRAKLMGTDDAARAYEGALDRLHDALAQSTTPTGRGLPPIAASGSDKKCLAGDPGCGLDGKPLF